MYANRRNSQFEIRNYRISGSSSTMVPSEFRPEIKIWHFRACAVKIRNITLIYSGIAEISRVLVEVGVEEHDGDVRF